MNVNNRRVLIVNSLYLFFRMVLTLLMSLVTTRLILKELGVVDFGIYSVISGFVAMFSFVNTAMSSASLRFFALEIGKGDNSDLNVIFSNSVIVHLGLGIILMILAETIGYWFFINKFNLPVNRFNESKIVFHISAIILLLNIVTVPFYAIILSFEKMKVIAFVSVAEVVLKFLAVHLMIYTQWDKLLFYSTALLLLQSIISFFYYKYSTGKFENLKIIFKPQKKVIKSLSYFSMWSIWGSLSWVLMGQGLNVLLNIFFGPIVNSARGIAFQVNALIINFVASFRIAVNPRIIKSFSNDDTNRLTSITLVSTEFFYYIVLFIFTPLYLEIDYLLKLWLVEPPEYTIQFCKLVLINTLIHTLDIGPIFSASGRIKENQLFGGMIYLTILPISYFFIKAGYEPSIVFYIQIIATIISNLFVNVILMKKVLKIPSLIIIRNLFLPTLSITFFVFVIAFFTKLNFSEGFYRVLIISMAVLCSLFLGIYFMGSFSAKNIARNIKASLL